MKDIVIPALILILILGGLIFGVSFLFNFDGNDQELPTANEEDEDDNKPLDINMNTSNASNTFNTSDNPILTSGMIAIINTNHGEIKLELFGSDAPKTVANFVKLAGEGFYNGTKFHRVIKGFMIQGGDPLTKDDSLMDRWGTGGPGYKFDDEIRANNKNVAGTISMANSGPNTNGSQFFINTADNNSLDTRHTVFGVVIEGMDVVIKIENVQTETQDRPVESVIVESITIME